MAVIMVIMDTRDIMDSTAGMALIYITNITDITGS
jgi:hypothetical protein